MTNCELYTLNESLNCPSPVTVDRALVHLSRRACGLQYSGSKGLQLCAHATHAGERLESVGPALWIMVHHL